MGARELLGVAVVAGLLLGSGPVTAVAKDCGGEQECHCGDKVVRDYSLRASIGPCKESGLHVAARVVLDGGGHTLLGSGRDKSWGLRVTREGSGSRIRNLKVTGFGRGVRLQGTSDVEIRDVESYRNGNTIKHVGYGIDVAGGASNNLITGVDVHHNADEGIHIGSDAVGNRVVDSRVHDNFRENVYFLQNRGNRLERSRLENPGQGHAAIYVKNARDNVIADTTSDGGPLQIRGSSTGTRIQGTKLTGGGLVLQAYDDIRPSDTVMEGGSIRAGQACVRIDAARQTRIDGVAMDCKPTIQIDGDSDLTVVNATVDKVQCAGRGQILVEDSVEFTTLDAAGAPIAGAEVRAAGQTLGHTDASGRFAGKLPAETILCPNPNRRAGGTDLTISSGALRRTVPAIEARGELVLKDP